MADKARSVPNSTDTVFCLASVTKLFTAVAIAQLVQQGRLEFGKTLGAYLSGFPSAANAITLHHLLTHTSGMGDYHALDGWFPAAATWTSADQVLSATMDFIREAPPAFPPGTGHQYSNSAYTVLGAIAQQVSGQPYKDLYEAYGPAATLRGGKWAIGHNGGSQGKSTLVEWYAGEWTAVKLSNYDPQDTMPVDDEIQGILTR